MKKYCVKENTNYGKRFTAADWIDVAIVKAENKEEAVEKIFWPTGSEDVQRLTDMTGRNSEAMKAFIIKKG